MAGVLSPAVVGWSPRWGYAAFLLDFRSEEAALAGERGSSGNRATRKHAAEPAGLRKKAFGFSSERAWGLEVK